MTEKPTYEELEQRIRELENCLDEFEQKQLILQKSELMFRAIFDQSFQFAVILDNNGNAIEVNDLCYEICGEFAEGVVGNPFWDATWWKQFPEVRKSTQISVQKTLKGNIITDEAIFIDKDKQIRHGIRIFSPIKDETDKIQLISVVGLDVSDREQAEEALKEKEEHYRTLINEMPNGFALHEIIVDNNGEPTDYQFLEVNSAFEEMTGFQGENIVGKTVLEVLPKTEPYWIETYGKVALAGKSIHFENYSQELDKYFEVLAYSPQRGQFATVFTDITDRKQAEVELKSEKEFATSLIENAPTFFVAIDAQGKTTMMNQYMLKTLGYKGDEVVGKDYLSNFVPEREREMLASVFKKLAAEYKPTLAENHILSKEGNEFLVEWHGMPVFDAGGEFQYFYGIGIDITDRKQTDEALRDSEQRFRNLSESTSDWVWEVDRDGVYTYSSPKVTDLLGYEPEEVIGKRPFDFMAPEEAKRISEIFNDFASLLEPFDSIENTNIHKNGYPVVMETSGVPIFNSEGAFSGYRGIDRDITDRKMATARIEHLNFLKEELLVSASLSEKLKRVTEGVVKIFKADFCRIWVTKPGDLCELDCFHAEVTEGPHACRYRDLCLHLMASSGRYTHVDGGHRRVPFGAYKIGRVASGEDADFITNDVVNDPRVHNHDWARENGLVSFAGYRLLTTQGDAIGVLALFSKKLLSSDEHALLKGVASATTQVIQTAMAEKELRESEEFLRAIIENIPDMIFVKDAKELRFVRFNKAGEELLGYSREELIGKNDYDFFPKEEADFFTEKDRDVLSSREFLDIPEEPIQTKYKGERTLHTKKFSVFNEEGKPRYLLGISEDITDRKREEGEKKELEAQLQQAQKIEAVGILSGGIAHDFNNLLSVIVGNIELAKDDIKQEVGVSNFLIEAEKASLQARELTNQLITFSKGGAPLKKIGSIVDLITDISDITITQSNVKCEFSHPSNLRLVEFDEGQIRHAVSNMFVNAIESMPDGGIIGVRTDNFNLISEQGLPLPEGKYVKISVRDNGVGISEDHLSQVFDPYFSTKEMGAQKGMGLGLTTTYSIINRHDGHITVESELGQGTTFIIYLPACEKEIKELEPVETPVTEKDTIRTGRILLMDDEEMIRDLGRHMLSRFGYSTELAKDGSEAVELYKKAIDSGNPFEVVILDLTVKRGLGGKDAVKKILEIDPQAKAIVSSGYSNDPVITHFREYGFIEALPKPYTVKGLRDALNKITKK